MRTAVIAAALIARESVQAQLLPGGAISKGMQGLQLSKEQEYAIEILVIARAAQSSCGIKHNPTVLQNLLATHRVNFNAHAHKFYHDNTSVQINVIIQQKGKAMCSPVHRRHNF